METKNKKCIEYVIMKPLSGTERINQADRGHGMFKRSPSSLLYMDSTTNAYERLIIYNGIDTAGSYTLPMHIMLTACTLTLILVTTVLF